MQPHQRMILVVCLVIAAVTVIVVIGRRTSAEDRALVGRWVFEQNPQFVTTFNANGTGTHAISWGYGETFRWTVMEDRIRLNHPGYGPMDIMFRLEGDVLYLTDETQTYRYLRD